jgi:Tol biopolymer transport system component
VTSRASLREFSSFHVTGASKRPSADLIRNPNPYDSTLRFSPDGSAVAFVRWINDHAGDLYQVVTRTGEIKQLTFDKVSVTSLQWHPNSRELLFTSNRNGSRQLWRVPADGGSPAIVVNALRNPKFRHLTAKFNDRLHSHQIDVDISVRDISNRPGSSMALHHQVSGADHSPISRPTTGCCCLNQIDQERSRSGWPERTAPEPIAVTSLNDPSLGSSRWSPDGRQVIFSRATDGKPQIYLINADGSGLRQITRNPSNNILPDFSP